MDQLKWTSRVSFTFMDQNKADHQGQLYFLKISWVKIQLTLKARVSSAHEFIFLCQNKAGQQGHLYFHGPK